MQSPHPPKNIRHVICVSRHWLCQICNGRALDRVTKQKQRPNRQKLSKKCPKIVCVQTIFGHFSDIFSTFFGQFLDIFRTFFRHFSDILSTFPFSGLSNDLPVRLCQMLWELLCQMPFGKWKPRFARERQSKIICYGGKLHKEHLEQRSGQSSLEVLTRGRPFHMRFWRQQVSQQCETRRACRLAKEARLQKDKEASQCIHDGLRAQPSILVRSLFLKREVKSIFSLAALFFSMRP